MSVRDRAAELVDEAMCQECGFPQEVLNMTEGYEELVSQGWVCHPCGTFWSDMHADATARRHTETHNHFVQEVFANAFIAMA